MRRVLVRRHIVFVVAGLLLLPLGGVAMGGPAAPGLGATAAACASSTATAAARAAANPFQGAHPTCFMDQYGDTYTWATDATHRYLYGTVTAPSCTETTWPLLGSYVHKSGFQYELTGANPLGTGDPNCVPVFKIKGTWPHGAWYYTYGYGGQEFTFTVCGSRPVLPGAKGGPHR